METWQLQDAKNKFSALVEHALRHGPQMVTRHGVPAVIVMSAADYAKQQNPEKSFIEFLMSMPKLPDEWFKNGEDPFERLEGTMRDIDV